ncbi:ultraviolet-B receptor UVR8-like [Rutidosis leptorrhynchoides]|uniref:ultraviolet-B receptor UVR8-like n=1 Tax=Rutidosis leptorrhynchoides TaxID=125765 RepID=UPI003A99248C
MHHMADTRKYVDSGNLSRRVVSIAAGESHTLALTGDGSVYSWGRGTFGRLGTGSELDRLFPAKIEFNSTKPVKIVGVAAGAYHSLALSDDGSVWSWGHNTYGQLGFNGENSMVPSLVEVFNGLSPPHGSITNSETGLKISSIKAGGMMSLAIDDLGSLWIWGNCPPQDPPNEGEEFSLVATYTPTPVWNFHGQTVVKVACGSEHIVALVSVGETHKGGDLVCYSWGSNNHGQLGLGDTNIRTTPQIIETFNTKSNWAAYELACGAFHTSILAYKKGDGEINKSVCWCFGLGDNGQLGLGTTKKALVPDIVRSLPVNLWLISVDCGLFHTSVVSSVGDVWSWGMENGLGLCNEASFNESEGGDALIPRLISYNDEYGSKFPYPIQVACGAAHTILLADNGYRLWSWGRGRSGVLGNGQVNDFFDPNLVLWPPLQEVFVKYDEQQQYPIPQIHEYKNEYKKNDDKMDNYKKSDENMDAEKSLVDITEIEKKLLVMERYTSMLHSSVFGTPFKEENDLPMFLNDAGSFDVGKEWEKMLESYDDSTLVRLETFYRNMLAAVKDKIMKKKIKKMVKECLESSTNMSD